MWNLREFADIRGHPGCTPREKHLRRFEGISGDVKSFEAIDPIGEVKLNRTRGYLKIGRGVE